MRWRCLAWCMRVTLFMHSTTLLARTVCRNAQRPDDTQFANLLRSFAQMVRCNGSAMRVARPSPTRGRLSRSHHKRTKGFTQLGTSNSTANATGDSISSNPVAWPTVTRYGSFLLTDRGVKLTEVYLGPEGVLTGSARLAQAATAKATAVQRSMEIERKRGELARRQQAAGPKLRSTVAISNR